MIPNKIFIPLFSIMLPLLSEAQLNTTTNNSKPFSSGLGAVDYNLQLGTQAGVSSGNSSFLNTYFSPSAKFDVSKKFSIIAGVGTSFTQLNNYTALNSEGNLIKTDAKLTSIYTYATGNYKLTPKLNVNAGVFVEQVYTNLPGNGPTMNKNYKDISLGVNYNISRHVSFNAQIQFSDRPYHTNNPYQGLYGVQGFQNYSGFSPFY